MAVCTVQCSRFCLGMSDGHRRVKRHHGERHEIDFAVERHVRIPYYGSSGVGGNCDSLMRRCRVGDNRRAS